MAKRPGWVVSASHPLELFPAFVICGHRLIGPLHLDIQQHPRQPPDRCAVPRHHEPAPLALPGRPRRRSRAPFLIDVTLTVMTAAVVAAPPGPWTCPAGTGGLQDRRGIGDPRAAQTRVARWRSVPLTHRSNTPAGAGGRSRRLVALTAALTPRRRGRGRSGRRSRRRTGPGSWRPRR
jgi:hypothetical protein